jgi:hypothetical protein
MMDDGGIPSFAKWNDGPRVGSDLMLTLQAIPHNPAGFGGNARAEDGGNSGRTIRQDGSLDWTGPLLWPCGPREYHFPEPMPRAYVSAAERLFILCSIYY